jgi:DNA-binding transcriptional ArsR family regulator
MPTVPELAVSTPAREHAAMLARFFYGLDDPTRVLILQLLLGGEKTVSELVGAIGSPQGRISTHLGCLRHCGYVRTRREGRRVYYRLADERVRALLRIAQELMADHAQELLSCAVVSPDMPGASLHDPEDDADRPAGAGRKQETPSG